MQTNLDRGELAIVASYALMGAIMLLRGAGLAADRYHCECAECLVCRALNFVDNGVVLQRSRRKCQS